jgi:hypothetical protein
VSKDTGHALRPWIGPHLPQRATIASAANRPWDMERSKLEHSAARESGISRAQALPAELNRFALKIGLRAASAHRETGVAVPVRFSAGETAGVAMPVRFSFCFFFFRSYHFWRLPPRLATGLSAKAWNASVLHPAGGQSLPWRPISGCAESTRDVPREAC